MYLPNNNPRLMHNYDYKAETLFFSYSPIPNYTVIYLTHFLMDVSAKPFVAIPWPSWDQFFTHVPCTYFTFKIFTNRKGREWDSLPFVSWA